MSVVWAPYSRSLAVRLKLKTSELLVQRLEVSSNYDFTSNLCSIPVRPRMLIVAVRTLLIVVVVSVDFASSTYLSAILSQPDQKYIKKRSFNKQKWLPLFSDYGAFRQTNQVIDLASRLHFQTMRIVVWEQVTFFRIAGTACQNNVESIVRATQRLRVHVVLGGL